MAFAHKYTPLQESSHTWGASYQSLLFLRGLGVSLVPQTVKSVCCNAGDPGSMPGSGRAPWGRERPPTPVFLPGESQGQRKLVGYMVLGWRRVRVGHD